MKKILLSLALFIAFAASSASSEQRIYWSSPHDGNEGIFSAKMDGTDIVRILDLRDPNTVLGFFRRPGAIAIDDINERLYFADTSNNDVLSINFQGGDPQLVYDEGTPRITDLDFDPISRTIYYTTDTGYVGKKPLSGAFVQSFPTGFNGIAVAPLSAPNGHLYFGLGNGVRYYELSNFAGGTFYLTNTAYAVDKIEYMHTADRLAFYNPDNNQIMIRQLGSPGDTVLFQFPDYAYVPEFMAFDRNETVMLWTNDTNDKIYIAPVAIQAIPDPPSTLINITSPEGIAISCGKLAPDPDEDGTPSCDEFCPNDPLKTLPGTCGCGIPEGSCPTPTPTSIPTSAPSHTPTPESPSEPTIRELAPGIKITEPPIVIINNKTVTLIFEKFLKTVLNKPGKNGKSAFLLAAKNPKITSRYSITIKNTSAKTKDVKTLSTKKNQLTLKNLKPGNYSVSYRAEILKDGKVAARTNLSPAASFKVL